MGFIISGLVIGIIGKTSYNARESSPATHNDAPAISQVYNSNTKDFKQSDTPTTAKYGANVGTSNAPNEPEKASPAQNQVKSPVETAPEAEYVTFVIPKGSNSGKISELLFNAGLISDKDKFQNVVEKMKAARKFKAGTFSISKGASEMDIVLTLTKAK